MIPGLKLFLRRCFIFITAGGAKNISSFFHLFVIYSKLLLIFALELIILKDKIHGCGYT
jgi:hypothetical protein